MNHLRHHWPLYAIAAIWLAACINAALSWIEAFPA